MNRTHSITQYENKAIKKAKNALYLVLKKKTFADEIITSLQNEVEQRFKRFINDIAKDLENIQLEDEETGLKYIILKGIINILNKMLQERMVTLSDKDKQLINDIFEKENESTEDLKVEPKYGVYPNYGESPNKGKNSSNPYGNPNPHGNLYPYGNPNPHGNLYPYGNPNPQGNPYTFGNPNPFGGPCPFGNPNP
jgi:hypothetical protein